MSKPIMSIYHALRIEQCSLSGSLYMKGFLSLPTVCSPVVVETIYTGYSDTALHMLTAP